MSRARDRWLALGVLCASLLAIVVDNTIVNVALPTLARDLGADVSELQWVVDEANFIGYILYSVWLIAFGVVLLVRERRVAQTASGARRPATS